jgi:hypothetical protein
MLLRAWLVDHGWQVLCFRAVHLRLPHRSRLRHDRTLRG